MSLPIKLVAIGGDALDELGKSKFFPEHAEQVFYSSIGNWDTGRSEKWQYLDRPVDDDFRLFIRYERGRIKGTGRARPYEVGFLLPRHAYVAYGNLSRLHQVLLSIPLSELAECWASEGSYTLPFPAASSCGEAVAASRSLEQLIIRCDAEDVEADINEISSSFVAADIETWFSKLYFVVNPYKVREEVNVVVSSVYLDAPQSADESESDVEPKRGWKELRWTAAQGVCTLIGGASVCVCPVLYKQIDALNQQYAELQQQNAELQRQNAELQRQNAELQKKYNNLLPQLELYQKLNNYPDP